MPNLSQVLKAEIARIGRKQAKSALSPLRQSNSALKRNVLDLRNRVAVLEAALKEIMPFYKKAREEAAKIDPEEAEKARITAKGVRALRKKLGLSRDGFAKLIGISSQTVFGMEKKDGKLKLRQETALKLLSIRGLGRREAKKRLEEMEQVKE